MLGKHPGWTSKPGVLKLHGYPPSESRRLSFQMKQLLECKQLQYLAEIYSWNYQKPFSYSLHIYPPPEDESHGASGEVHTTPADTADVVDAHVIPGNLSPAQPVVTSQLSDYDSSETLLKSSYSPDRDSDIPLPPPKLGSVTKLAQKPSQYT